MSSPIQYHFHEFFAQGQYETEVEYLATGERNQKLTIGIPKEIILDENRVALVPNSIRTLVGYGHHVLVESNAGKQAYYTDLDYSEAGAEITEDTRKVFASSVLIKMAPPTLEEISMMSSGQVLISPLQMPVLPENYLEKLKEKKITALAMEYLRSEDGSFPIVKIISEIAGTSAIFTAAEYLAKNQEQGRGLLLGSVSGVPPAKIVILGAGVVAETAIKIALGLGASVRVFDNNITKLSRLQHNVGRQLHTSSINPVYLAYQLTSADVVIGAIHSKSGRTPILITEEMVSKMKNGAVIIDVSIDQGGCIETSKLTTNTSPSFIKHGVMHHCVPNMASKVCRTASIAISNIITPLILKMGSALNFEDLLYNASGIRQGCYTYKGYVTNEYLSKRFSAKYTPIELLITSKL